MKIDGGSKCTLCGKQFISQTFNTSNIIKLIMEKHRNSEASAKLKEEIEVKKQKLREVKKVKENKLKESKKLCQSSMLTFTTKTLPIDPLKKKRIEEALIKHVIVENELLRNTALETYSFKLSLPSSAHLKQNSLGWSTALLRVPGKHSLKNLPKIYQRSSSKLFSLLVTMGHLVIVFDHIRMCSQLQDAPKTSK